jgi:hypothetical protein
MIGQSQGPYDYSETPNRNYIERHSDAQYVLERTMRYEHHTTRQVWLEELDSIGKLTFIPFCIMI